MKTAEVSVQDQTLEARLAPSRLLAFRRAALMLLWTLFMMLVNLRSCLGGHGLPGVETMRWHRVVLKITGIEVQVHGTPIRDRPVMFLPNHVSYLDIPVLGSLLPCSFVSKAEVRDWPAFGWLAVQQRTIFIKRDPRQAANQLQEMRERLEEGGCLVLFPEGTSSDGSRVLPFKSSLLQASTIEFPETGQIEVQPVSIAYTRLDGVPMGRALRPFFAWYGDMELAPHLIDLLGMGSLGVEVVFHDPIRLADTGDRKGLARLAWEKTSDGLADALRGRYQA
ncbi:MAG: lysophospholipid acyltransferase family protein [Alphaproteobacteria bacterium]